jgi:hypothetical protein
VSDKVSIPADTGTAGHNHLCYNLVHNQQIPWVVVSVGFLTMRSAKRKLHILFAITILLLFAVGVGCRGFFQNPQLQTVTVGPQNANIQQGSTLQMTATGTFDDGTTKTLTKNVFWSSNDQSIAAVSQSGVITGNASGNATITASSGAVSGSTQITVSLMNVTGITINPKTFSTQPNTNVNYTAMATVTGGQPVDVTSTTTFTSNNPMVTFTNGANPAVAMVGNITSATTVTITATYVSSNGTFTDTGTLNVQ